MNTLSHQYLKGKSIDLRLTTPEDLETIGKLWNEDSILLGNRSTIFPTYESENQQLFKEWSTNQTRSGFGLTIADKEGNFVGHLTIFNLTLPALVGTIAIFIDPNYQGKGYGLEALQMGLKIAFEELNAHKVELNVYSYNERAIHVYQKAGFIIEGTKRASTYHKGQYFDTIIMGMLKEEFYQ